MARRGAIHPRWEWSRLEASDIDVGPEGERTGVSESIEARERNSQALRHTSYPRRESNPHLRFRKPPFYPLNYGDSFQRSDIRYRRSDFKFGLWTGSLTSDLSPSQRPSSRGSERYST